MLISIPQPKGNVFRRIILSEQQLKTQQYSKYSSLNQRKLFLC